MSVDIISGRCLLLREEGRTEGRGANAEEDPEREAAT